MAEFVALLFDQVIQPLLSLSLQLLGSSIVPVAIKYNSTFTDAFWNSRKQSFPQHLFKLMTSWALVVDVHYLQPQSRREGESSAQFAARVKEMIAK